MVEEDMAAALCAVGVPFLSRVVKALSLGSRLGHHACRDFARVEDLATAIGKNGNLASAFRWLFRCHFARTCAL